MAAAPPQSLSSADGSASLSGEPSSTPVLPPLSLDVSNDLLHSYNEQLGASQELPQADNEVAAAQVTSFNEPNSPVLQMPDNTKGKLLAIPGTISASYGNPSQTSFVLSEPGSTAIGENDGLLPEIARADVSIAADGSFVQTSSALAARELKKSYDKILGVGQGGVQGVVRSPYAITAIPDGKGGTVFRISHRVQDGQLDETSTEFGNHQTQGRGRWKGRLSVQDFLPTSMFKHHGNDHGLSRHSTSTYVGHSYASNTVSSTSSQGRRKLRKPRSNTDLRITTSPPNVADNSSHLSPPPRSETFSIEIRDEITAGADAFSQVLGWSSELASDTIPASRKASKSSVPLISEDTLKHQEVLTSIGNTVDTAMSRRPSVSTSAALFNTNGETFVNPFGDNIRYTTPMGRTPVRVESPVHQLREVQSFESGLTAKIDDGHAKSSGPGTPKVTATMPDLDHETPLNSVQSQTHFSTKVFDVLQTYKGLPVPSSFLAVPPTGATIKMSATDSANPKDDPRFVIWGEIQPEGAMRDDASQSSHTDLSASSAASGPPRKRSNARPPPQGLQVVVDTETTPVQTVLIAATIERWIAQLTSEMDYDELLNFLLTYRTYISPIDLCHLLICRFHWALETPTSKQDETVRRIIRVRTFIAIRYWLLTFFREDFLVNSELCCLFTSWLNSLSKDPTLKTRPDALSIVRKLKKNVRECKAAHSTVTLHSPVKAAHSGENTKLGGEDKQEDLDDSDVDLDFPPTGSSHLGSLNDSSTMGIPKSFGNDQRSSVIFSTPPQGRAAGVSANSVLLSQPLSKTILEHVKPTKLSMDPSLVQNQPSFASQHSAISRAFVNTIGRLGRWKRVLNARSAVAAPYCGDISQFDLEPNATGDLLVVRGGVEEYLKMLNLAPHNVADARNHDLPSETGPVSRPLGLDTPLAETEPTEPTQVVELSSEATEAVTAISDVSEATEAVTAISDVSESTDADSIYPASVAKTEAAGDDEADNEHEDPAVPPGFSPEVVSLDNYDLSSSDSGSHRSTKVRRLPRRLPLRREFQFVRRSLASISSMGIRSRSSAGSSIRSGSPMSRRSIVSATHRSIADDDDGEPIGRPLGNPYFVWQVGLISDDEDEAGDAEAALRRLEGQIDVDRQREKEMKVGRWLKTARELELNGAKDMPSDDENVDDEREHEDGGRSVLHDMEDPTVGPPGLTHSQVAPSEHTQAAEGTIVDATVSMPTTTSPPRAATVAGVASSTLDQIRDRSGSVSSAQDSILTHSQNSLEIPRPSILTSNVRVRSQFGPANTKQYHRSFILLHRSEILAQQFAIIEAELFTKIKFEELISHQWGQSLEDVDIRDWLLFVKERSSLKNTNPSATGKSSAILALRARFDLLVNFTASEVMLTHSNERVLLVEKFIRIAWKMYLHNNFGSLVALIAGLQTRWVNQAMERRWGKVGIWEQRIFEDLKRFTSRVGQFKYIRNATAALIDAQPLQTLSQDHANNGSTTSPSSSSKPRASEVKDTLTPCVPFLGAYLAQLYNYERLPDFVDPTAPTRPVLINNDTGTLSPPSQPDVFFNLQPLPDGLTLEPLTNVHKQRLIAGVIKSFVGGQHLATNISFKVDHKCYQKCYRLRSLSSEALQNLLTSSRSLGRAA